MWIWLPGSASSLSRSLVLDAIADAEQITVSDEDVDAELAQVTSDPQRSSTSTPDATPAWRERVRSALRQAKTVRYLLDLAAPAAADEPSGTNDQPEAMQLDDSRHQA